MQPACGSLPRRMNQWRKSHLRVVAQVEVGHIGARHVLGREHLPHVLHDLLVPLQAPSGAVVVLGRHPGRRAGAWCVSGAAVASGWISETACTGWVGEIWWIHNLHEALWAAADLLRS